MNKKIQTQRIIKVGNSLAVTLDSDFIKKYNLKARQQLYVLYTHQPPRVVVKPDLTEGPSFTKEDVEKFPKEYRDWIENFLKEDKEALDALAKF